MSARRGASVTGPDQEGWIARAVAGELKAKLVLSNAIAAGKLAQTMITRRGKVTLA